MSSTPPPVPHRHLAQHLSLPQSRTGISHILNTAVELRDILPVDIKGRFHEKTVPFVDDGVDFQDLSTLARLKLAVAWLAEAKTRTSSTEAESTAMMGGAAARGVSTSTPGDSSAPGQTQPPVGQHQKSKGAVLVHCTQGVLRTFFRHFFLTQEFIIEGGSHGGTERQTSGMLSFQ